MQVRAATPERTQERWLQYFQVTGWESRHHQCGHHQDLKNCVFKWVCLPLDFVTIMNIKSQDHWRVWESTHFSTLGELWCWSKPIYTGVACAKFTYLCSRLAQPLAAQGAILTSLSSSFCRACLWVSNSFCTNAIAFSAFFNSFWKISSSGDGWAMPRKVAERDYYQTEVFSLNFTFKNS